MENLRRIVTGHDEEGKSIVIIDGGPSRTIGEDVGGWFEIWNTDGKKIDTLDNRDRADIEIILSPEANGTKFRYFEIQPTPKNIPIEKLEEAAAIAFEKIGATHERIDTSRHHAMHQTKTIDYIILLKGDVTLLLDKDMSIEEELAEYHSYILELKEGTVKQIIGIFHDYSKEAEVG